MCRYKEHERKMLGKSQFVLRKYVGTLARTLLRNRHCTHKQEEGWKHAHFFCCRSSWMITLTFFFLHCCPSFCPVHTPNNDNRLRCTRPRRLTLASPSSAPSSTPLASSRPCSPGYPPTRLCLVRAACEGKPPPFFLAQGKEAA